MTKKLPYLENHSLMDGRLVICGLAVGIAMFALAWDFFYPFPKVCVYTNRLYLISSCWNLSGRVLTKTGYL